MLDPFVQLARATFPERALSLYLPGGPALDQAYHHALLKDLLRDWSMVFGRDKRLALEREMKRTRDFLDQTSAGGHPLAVFACEPAGLFEVYRLPEHVQAQLWIDTQLHLDPLLAMLERPGTASIIVAIDKERARVFTRVLERLEQVAELRGEPIKRHRQGGWSEEKFQRHEDLKSEANIRAVVDWVVDHRDAYPGPITVVGPPEARNSFVDHLPPLLRRAAVIQLGAPIYLQSGALKERLRTQD